VILNHKQPSPEEKTVSERKKHLERRLNPNKYFPHKNFDQKRPVI
jgi:hypothetical protein